MKTLKRSRPLLSSSEGSPMSEAMLRARPLLVAAVGLLALSTGGERVALGNGPPGSAGIPLPQIESDGGPVLATPVVVPVLFSSDPLVGPLTDYFAKLGASGYLGSALGEYGVTGVTVAPPVILTDPAPAGIGDEDMDYWLGSLIDAGTLPPADGNTMLHVVFPSSTQVFTGEWVGLFTPTCTPGISTAITAEFNFAAFSYVPRCEGSTFGLSDLDYVTARGTAAMADAIVSPYWLLGEAAYSDASWHGSGWASLMANPAYGTVGVGEMCLATAHEATATPSAIGYLVPRIWSDEAAAAGHAPCADPTAEPQPYFNAAPDIAGGTFFLAAGYATIAKGVILPAGGQVTLPLRLFSDAPAGEWHLSAVERTDLAPDPSNILSFSFDNDRGRSGNVRMLTISRAATADGSLAQNLAFDIVSTNGDATHEWLVVVGNE